MINKWKRGETITAARLNESVEAINRRERLLQMGQLGIGGKQVVIVMSVHNDHLVCRPLNTTPYAIEIKVAKPWDLRTSNYTAAPFIRGEQDEETYTAVAITGYRMNVTRESDDEEETWRIVPPYTPYSVIDGTVYEGSQITIERMPENARFTVAGTGYQIELEWVDCNAAGRLWAKI